MFVVRLQYKVGFTKEAVNLEMDSEKLNKFRETATCYFSEKNILTDFYSMVGHIDENLNKMDQSTNRLNGSI